MGLHVRQKVALFSKRLFAVFVRTYKWTLTSLKSVKSAYMQSHVDFEAAGARVAFIA